MIVHECLQALRSYDEPSSRPGSPYQDKSAQPDEDFPRSNGTHCGAGGDEDCHEQNEACSSVRFVGEFEGREVYDVREYVSGECCESVVQGRESDTYGWEDVHRGLQQQQESVAMRVIHQRALRDVHVNCRSARDSACASAAENWRADGATDAQVIPAQPVGAVRYSEDLADANLVHTTRTPLRVTQATNDDRHGHGHTVTGYLCDPGDASAGIKLVKTIKTPLRDAQGADRGISSVGVTPRSRARARIGSGELPDVPFLVS
jgi:hypothetical protein